MTDWKKKRSALPLHLQNILYHLSALERYLPKMQFFFLKVKCISLVKKMKQQLYVLVTPMKAT